MILALDIGNTNVVLGCIADGEILFTERMATDSGKTELDYAISLKMVLELREIKVSEITGAIIGSVVPPVTSLMREAIRKVTGQEALVVNVDMNIGLEVLMDNPSSVGTDLIVGAVAGINRYPVPLILIDMGTATTICVVNENKQYIGGMILPGIGVSMNSLTSRTAQLPRISLDPPKRLIGKNTVECMQSGALYGNASCIDGMVDRIQEELGQEATIVATGGLAKRIIPLCLLPVSCGPPKRAGRAFFHYRAAIRASAARRVWRRKMAVRVRLTTSAMGKLSQTSSSRPLRESR